MTAPKHQRRARGEVAPVPPRAKSSRALAPAAQEGDPAASAHLVAGLDVPVPTGSHTTAGAGRKQPGPVVAGKTAAGPGDQPEPEALSGKAFRAAFKAARSAKAKTQRQQGARPRTKRDPYRKAVPGGRVLPPKDDV